MSLRGTKQSHGEKPPCIVRDCFVPRNDMVFFKHPHIYISAHSPISQIEKYLHIRTFTYLHIYLQSGELKSA